MPLTTKDVNGQITTFEYDPVTLRPKKVIPPSGGSMVETIYDDVNRKVTNKAQIDATNWAENITYYDGLGRSFKAEQVHSDGNIFVEKEFDADGRVLRVTNPFRSGEAKLWTTNVYDDAGRVIEVILPDGAKVKTDYGVSITGKIGTTKQITDQAGKKRKGITDVLGRMIRVIEDPTGQALETDYQFDTLGNLRKTIQGEQSRYFMHDSLGRLLYSKQPEEEANTAFVATDAITGNTAWSNKYVYDDNGNITSTTNARNVSVTATYDKFNRITLRNYSDVTPDVDFYYDGRGLGTIPNFSKGKTTRVSSSVSETRYTSFDNLGKLLTHEQRTTAGQIAGTENAYQTEYTYNLSGAILTEKYPSGRVLTYDYRQDGELDKVSGVKAGQTSAYTYLNNISYDTLGNVEKLRLGNGTWETAEYNDRQQVSQIGLGHSSTDKSLLKIDYAYGTNTQNNGSLKQQTISYYGLPNQIIQDYTYDDLNRLKSSTETVQGNSTPTWKQTFNYDRYGNREFDATNTTTLASGVASKITNPDIETSNNRLKEDQDNDSVNDYDYDKSGNVTLDAENKRFIYDAENRIKEFFKGTNSGTTPDAKYEYDGDGKRVRKLDGTIETIFVYNASGQLVAEYSNQMPQNPKISYLTSDHLGSPRIVTDGGKAVVSRHDYLAFGDEVTDTVGNVAGRTTQQGYGNEDEIRKQYTGYERDKESGLDYAQARYYNSGHGRFTSVDPLTASANVKDPQTFNRYSYVLNSPYKFTDPLGLLSVTTGACGQWCSNVDDGGGGGGISGGAASGGFSLFETSVESYSIDNPQQTSSSSGATSPQAFTHGYSGPTYNPDALLPESDPMDDTLEYQEYLSIPRPDFVFYNVVQPTNVYNSTEISLPSPYNSGIAGQIIFTLIDQFGNPLTKDSGYLVDEIITVNERIGSTGSLVTANRAEINENNQVVDDVGKFAGHSQIESTYNIDGLLTQFVRERYLLDTTQRGSVKVRGGTEVFTFTNRRILTNLNEDRTGLGEFDNVRQNNFTLRVIQFTQ